jgi:hypothetical protein
MPEDYEGTPKLTRSIADFADIQKPRRLPLLKDVLSRLYQASDADFLIYTNVDIALLPSFYLAVAALIDRGHDAFVINRRTIPATYSEVADLPLMYAEAGEPHPGHDCFVFRRDRYPEFDLGNVCVGAPHVGQVLLWNLLLTGERFTEFRDLHLTFHIGDDKKWKQGHNQSYWTFNRGQAEAVLSRLEERFGPFSKDHPITPYIHPLPRHGNAQGAAATTRRARRGGWLGRLVGRTDDRG